MIANAKQAKRRRRNGEGSIYQRKDGRWCATITIGCNGQGKRIRQSVYGKTMGEVRDQLTDLQKNKLDGTIGEPSREKLADFLRRWLDDVVRPSRKLTTWVSYDNVVRNHVSPRIGGVRLQKLTPAHVQGLYSAMERDGASPRMRQLTHAVLRRALNQAVRWDMVPRNVCTAVDPPRGSGRKMQPLDAEQAAKLLETAKGDRLESLYILAVTTGMRSGELYGLQWRDVDLQGATLSVRHTLSEVAGKQELTEPKTPKSRRKIDLSQMDVEALHEHRKRMLAEGHAGCPFVFCSRNGTPLRRTSRRFKRLLKGAKLPKIRFHDLRHTAATLMLLAGVHPKVVQERLGHSTISITLDTYSHVLPSMQRDAADKIQSVLRAVGA